MLKRFFFLIFLTLAASNTAFTDYFYIGGTVGLSSLNTQQSTTSPNERHNLGGFGFTGGFLAGYCFGAPCQPLDLGLELFINGNTSENSIVHRQDTTRFRIHSRYNWGIRALPGYRFSDDLETHLIFGYALGNFSINDNGAYGTVSKNFNANGFQFGAGFTITLSCYVSLRVDGIYTGYGYHHAPGIANLLDADEVYTARPRNFDGTITLLCNF